jgi:hypothetical protein
MDTGRASGCGTTILVERMSAVWNTEVADSVLLSQMKWLPELGYGIVLLTNSSDQDYGHVQEQQTLQDMQLTSHAADMRDNPSQHHRRDERTG